MLEADREADLEILVVAALVRGTGGGGVFWASPSRMADTRFLIGRGLSE